MKANKKVVSLIHNDFEDLELMYPILRLREEGVEVIVAGEKANETYIGKYGVPALSDCTFSEVTVEEFDGILIPGGWAPDKLRRFPEVIAMVQKMDKENKVIGQICHAGWVAISAKILNGRKVTSTPGIKDDMENAGATWIDEAVVVDKNLVSSRRPMDLPFYMKKYIEILNNNTSI